MPIDLAKESEDAKLLDYFSAILSDLHGKPAARWNVSHDRGFVLPQDDELDLPSHPESEDDAGDFQFEVTSQPLPPQYMLSNHPGDKFVLAADLRRFNDSTKLSSRLTTLKLTRDEFTRTAYCCLVGGLVDVGKNEEVVLVKVDATLKKLLGVDDPKLHNNLPAVAGSARKRSS